MKLLTVKPDFLKQRCIQRGYTLEEVMGCVVDQLDDLWIIDVEHKMYPHPKSNHMIQVPDHPRNNKDIIKEEEFGAGYELKKMLSYMNIKASPNCSCNQKAKIMNDNGNQWCRDNKDLILSWLAYEAKKRKLPFVKFFGSKLIDLAIARAERKQTKCSN